MASLQRQMQSRSSSTAHVQTQHRCQLDKAVFCSVYDQCFYVVDTRFTLPRLAS